MTRWLLLAAFALFTITYGQDQEELSIPLPAGSTYDEKSKLLCTPLRWPQAAAFYFANYFSHAATIRVSPGERWRAVIATIMLALFLPHTGLYRAMIAIRRRAVFYGKASGGNDLRMAARAGALCVVVRGTGWKPYMAKGPISGVTVTRPYSSEARRERASRQTAEEYPLLVDSDKCIQPC